MGRNLNNYSGILSAVFEFLTLCLVFGSFICCLTTNGVDADNQGRTDQSITELLPDQVTAGPDHTTKTRVTHISSSWRAHTLNKLVKALTSDPAANPDLVAYAKRFEGDVYNRVNSRSGYVHRINRKIEEIQKELEEKKEQQQQTSESQISLNVQDPPANVTLLPSTEECGIQNIHSKVIEGTDTALDEFPWVALIEYEKANGTRGFYCGGVLINNRYILTATHCIKAQDVPRSWHVVGVRLGEHNIATPRDCESSDNGSKCAPPPLNVAVEEIITHEKYDPYYQNQYNDIALLRLAKPVIFTDFVKPICLPMAATFQDSQHTEYTSVGWATLGRTSTYKIKQKFPLPGKNIDECSKTYSQAGIELSADHLCAGGQKGNHSCRGDGGGPLMTYAVNEKDVINWFVIGVVSFGPVPCGLENWPDVYTKVANYVPWIISKLKP